MAGTRSVFPSFAPDPVERARLRERFGVPVRAGELLFREGQPATHAFVLDEGCVKVVRFVRGRERATTLTRPGTVFGELGFSDRAVHASEAVSMSDGCVLGIAPEVLKVLSTDHPALTQHLVLELTHRLTLAEDEVDLLSIEEPHARVVQALLQLARGTAGAVELSVTPAELGRMAGLDLRAVRIAMQTLREQQVVRIAGERVEIPDVDALRRVEAPFSTRFELPRR